MSLSPTATRTPRACPKCGRPTRRTHLCWRCECPPKSKAGGKAAAPARAVDPRMRHLMRPCPEGCGRLTKTGRDRCKYCEAARGERRESDSPERRRADRELAAMIGRYEAVRCDRARVTEAAKLEALIAGRLASEAAADPNRHLLLVVGGYAYQPAAGGRELMRWRAERPVYGTLANP